MKTNTPSKNFLIALLIGALSVPLLALAANGLIEGNGSQDKTVEAEAGSASDLLSSPIEKVVNDEGSSEDHLTAACGPDGHALIEKELDGSIEPIEQAALDALRPICDEAGMPLAEAPTPAPVVQQVVVVEQIAPTTASAGESSYEDGEKEDHEDEEHKEDEEDEEDDH